MPSLGSHDPLAAIQVSRERITEVRDQMEVAPVEVQGLTVDCREKDEKRMVDTLDQWDLVAPEGTISWVLANDEVQAFTKTELQSLLDGLRQVRAVRSAKLHTRARELKGRLPDVTERDLVGYNWGV